MIRFTCPECDAELEISDSTAGTRITCPECEHRFPVPEPARKKAPGPRTPPGGVKGQGPRRPPRGAFAKKQPKSNTGLLVAAIGGGVAVVLAIVGLAVWALTSGKGGGPASATAGTANAANSTPVSGPPVAKMGGPRSGRKGRPGGPMGGRGGLAKAKAAEDEQLDAATPEKTDQAEAKAEESKPASDPAAILAGQHISEADIFQFALKSTVLILAPIPGGFEQGSGTLIDRTHRWVLTARHVVPAQATDIMVFFPAYKNHNLVTEREEYLKQLKRSDVIHAKMVAQNENADLALLELNRVPDDALALPVARSSTKPGESVSSLGNPAGSTLWINTSGTVRQVTHRKWLVREGNQTHEYDASIVLTNSATNQGDSGGPLVSDRGELVGVVHGMDIMAWNIKLQNTSSFIDVTEVLKLVEDYAKAHSTTWDRATRTIKPSVSRTDVVRLVRALDSKDAQTRTDAAQALASIGPDARPAIQHLVRHLKDQDEFTRRLCQDALEKIGAPDRSDLTFLRVCLKDSNSDVRSYAAGAIGGIGPDGRAAIPDLLRLFKDQDPGVRQSAVRSLGKVGADSKDQVLSALTDALNDSDRDVRVAAGEAIANLNDLSAGDLPVLKEAMNHRDAAVCAAAIRALGKLGRAAKDCIPDIIKAARSPDKAVRQASVEVLARFGSQAKAALPVFQDALKDSDKQTRKAACTALGAFGTEAKTAVPDLATALSDTDPDVRKEAAVVLGKIGPDAKEAAAALGDSLKDGDYNYRRAAFTALRAMGPGAKPAIKGIIYLFYENDLDIATEAGKTLAKIGKDAVRDLAEALDDIKAPMRAGAARALGEMGPVVLTAKPWGHRARSKLASHTNPLVEPHPEVRTECANALQKIVLK